MAPLLLLVLAVGFLSIAGADDTAPSIPAAWLLLGSVPLVVMGTWIGVDRWYGRGMTIRILRHNRFLAVSAPIGWLLATISPAAALFGFRRSGIWFMFFLAQATWCCVILIAMTRAESRREKEEKEAAAL